jgi:hypothetical protein
MARDLRHGPGIAQPAGRFIVLNGETFVAIVVNAIDPANKPKLKVIVTSNRSV